MDDLYQELILDHNKRPRNRGHLDAPDRQAEGYNPLCGDRVHLELRIEDDRVVDVRFDGSGCAISTASASLMSEAIKGKSRAEIDALFQRFHDLVTRENGEGEGMGKLRAFAGVRRYPARVKCATLAWHTLQAALEGSEAPVTTE